MRTAGVKAVGLVRVEAAIDPLIAIMRKGGRLSTETADALYLITLRDYGANPKQWQKSIDQLRGFGWKMPSDEQVVKAKAAGSPEAAQAKTAALSYHRQLADIIETLNAARVELTRLANEYEASKALIVQARGDVRTAKKRGVQLEQRRKSATRREQLVRTTSSLRGLGGIGDDLAALDEQIEDGIDALEGAAYVAADMASQELGERQLDAQIAQGETDAAFEAELAAMEADTSEVIDVEPIQRADTPALPERSASAQEAPSFEPVPEREAVPVSRSSSGPSDFGNSDSGGSDSGSSD